MDKTWKVVAAFVGIFVAGLVVGGLVTLRVAKQLSPPRLGSPEQFGPQLMKRFTAKLELTPAQEETIKPMIDRAAEELHQVRRTTWVNSQAIIDRLDTAIAAQLTPAQKVKFDELRNEQRERIRRFTEERGRRLKDGRRPVIARRRPRLRPSEIGVARPEIRGMVRSGQVPCMGRRVNSARAGRQQR